MTTGELDWWLLEEPGVAAAIEVVVRRVLAVYPEGWEADDFKQEARVIVATNPVYATFWPDKPHYFRQELRFDLMDAVKYKAKKYEAIHYCDPTREPGDDE